MQFLRRISDGALIGGVSYTGERFGVTVDIKCDAIRLVTQLSPNEQVVR
ncbi:hypothetical protein Xekj_04172 [Xenorhabdus sp. KJ12.1]|nr:hypothetical protein Xekj_04172 [Xenorhabdus sp. KJ12.1]